jgi:hypothetical protein
VPAEPAVPPEEAEGPRPLPPVPPVPADPGLPTRPPTSVLNGVDAPLMEVLAPLALTTPAPTVMLNVWPDVTETG